MTRAAQQPGERLDRTQTLSFTFDGREVPAFAGDTIGSALYAAGRRTFSRSFKYHRRRGLLCCAGQCPNCLVAVDGAPGIRACTEPVRDGMDVRHLNAWPGLELDARRITDLVGGPFTPPGFYYKTFIRPRRMWPLYEKVLRHAAGLGVLPGHPVPRRRRTEYRRRHADVLVVGGGAAGMAAALAAASLGADVVLADEGPVPGGRMLADGDHEGARELALRVRAAGVEVLSSASVLGTYDGLAPVWQGDTLHQVRARAHVIATGTTEQPIVFAGNDLPGVMLSGAVQRLVALYAVVPGRRAVVVATGDHGPAAARRLESVGVEVAATVDLRDGDTIIAARGRHAVREAVLSGPGGARRRVACDLLVVAGTMAPTLSLALQAGATADFDERRGCFALATLPAGTYAAGSVAGDGDETVVGLSGTVAGTAAVVDLGLGGPEAATRLAGDRVALTAGARDAEDVAVPAAGAGADGARGRRFACLCEDVTVKDLRLTVQEGYDSIELAKRYSTATMGPCQGRMCQLACARLIAGETRRPMADVGLTTARPPWSTVPLAVLAGRPNEPAKRSAIHGRHRELGATIRWAGDWRRAYDYGDPAGEALAVQRAAGLIDVSTLGKLLVRGPDAGELLDRLYPNRLSDLAPGRIRYGVLLSEAGRITDDGTVCRLDDDTFYVTTTSSGAAAVEAWFQWWLTVWGLDAAVTDVTQGVAALNLAGPRARAVISGLTELDCGPQAFRYLDAREAEVAGVACLLLRIGFVGEVGYEIHCAAPHGQALWDALLAAGRDDGVRPFGLEPQRILRLQKLHVLVGQDTDSESTPLGAGMPWTVKLDKPQDFVGRRALELRMARDGGPETTMLVGFRCAGEHVPTEGAVVLGDDGRPAGQVTSARRSPLLDEVVGMAWVPAALARDDAQIVISDVGRRVAATVTTRPFYDPDGDVVRA